LIIEAIVGNSSAIYSGLPCFWETQSRLPHKMEIFRWTHKCFCHQWCEGETGV